MIRGGLAAATVAAGSAAGLLVGILFFENNIFIK